MKLPTKKSLPRNVQQVVWLSPGTGSMRQCRLVEVSEESAKLRLLDPAPVPQNFYLFFSPQALSRRHCELVSHNDADVELRFLGKEVASCQNVDRVLQWQPAEVPGADGPETVVLEP